MKKLAGLFVLAVILLMVSGCSVLERRYEATTAQANAASSASWSQAVTAQSNAQVLINAENNHTERLQTMALYFGRNNSQSLIDIVFWMVVGAVCAVLILAIAGVAILRRTDG